MPFPNTYGPISPIWKVSIKCPFFLQGTRREVVHFSCLKDQVTYWQYPITLHNKKRKKGQGNFWWWHIVTKWRNFSLLPLSYFCHQNGGKEAQIYRAKNTPFSQIAKYFFFASLPSGDRAAEIMRKLLVWWQKKSCLALTYMMLSSL